MVFLSLKVTLKMMINPEVEELLVSVMSDDKETSIGFS